MPRINRLLLLALLLGAAPALGDTIPETDEGSQLLTPVFSPFNLRMVGVLELGLMVTDGAPQHTFGSAYRNNLGDCKTGDGSPFDCAPYLGFNFEELGLVFDGRYGDSAFGFHVATLLTSRAGGTDTFSTPALAEGWATYQTEYGPLMAGRIRNPFGGRFTDQAEYHVSAARYRRFRTEGVRFDYRRDSGASAFVMPMAIMDNNHGRGAVALAARPGLEYSMPGLGTLRSGLSVFWGEEALHGRLNDTIITSALAGNTFLGDASFNRLDIGLDAELVFDALPEGLMGARSLYLEATFGMVSNTGLGFTPNPTAGTSDPELAGRVLAVWIEAIQALRVGSGASAFATLSYVNAAPSCEGTNNPPGYCTGGAPGASNRLELVLGYRQQIVRGVSFDVELWVTALDQPFPAGSADGSNGSYLKARLQYLF